VEAVIASDLCGLEDLVAQFNEDAETRARLRLGSEWPRRWSMTWRIDGREVSWPVRDMTHVPVLSTQPTRGFTWRRTQRHHPGLQYMVTTGRAHGFESIEESRLLVALDFLKAYEVLSQPFRLGFEHVDGKSWHVPDFLAENGEDSERTRWHHPPEQTHNSSGAGRSLRSVMQVQRTITP